MTGKHDCIAQSLGLYLILLLRETTNILERDLLRSIYVEIFNIDKAIWAHNLWIRLKDKHKYNFLKGYTFYELIPELITTQQMTNIHKQKTLSKPRQPVAGVLLKNTGTLSSGRTICFVYGKQGTGRLDTKAE